MDDDFQICEISAYRIVMVIGLLASPSHQPTTDTDNNLCFQDLYFLSRYSILDK